MKSRDSEPSPNAVIVSRIFLPEPAAASFRLAAVAQALAFDGLQVTVLTTEPPDDIRGQVAEGVPSNVDVRTTAVLRDSAGYVRGYLPYFSFDIPLFFRLLFLRFRPDVVLVEPPPTTGAVVRLVAQFRRFPYVWYAADIWSDAARAAGSSSLVVRALRAVEVFAVRGAAGVIAVSEEVAEYSRSLGARNVCVVANGADTSTYRSDVAPLSVDEMADLGIEGPYLIYAGTASEWQGADAFVDAFSHLCLEFPGLQLVFMGQGSQWATIGAKAEVVNSTAGRRAILQLPQSSPVLVARLLAGAKQSLVSIVPGRGYDFAYPTKILAALASGTPVLFAGVGPAARDIEMYRLGQVRRYNVEDIVAGIREMQTEDRDTEERLRLRRWVEENRSLSETGRRAARFVIRVARDWHGHH